MRTTPLPGIAEALSTAGGLFSSRFVCNCVRTADDLEAGAVHAAFERDGNTCQGCETTRDAESLEATIAWEPDDDPPRRTVVDVPGGTAEITDS